MLACITLCLLLSKMTIAGISDAHLPAYRHIKSFPMGDAQVTFCEAIPGRTAAHHALRKRGLDAGPPGPSSNSNSNPTLPTRSEPLDLTPAKCTSITCNPGTFQKPDLQDCEKVIQAQLYNSTGSLSAAPGTYVFVSYGTCATVFQNPEESSYPLQYNWAELGAQAGKIAGKCLLEEDKSMGGSCIFKKYLQYTFDDVMISLQRFDDRDIEMPK
ncbi:hypothetical protein PGTUg99_017734 [Puccinia graminis f. sp. tritici]|uniref:Uncharacterized protein n=1 Tax=Puccinia graminis f. sp. tritici TaxID=56615 RepID=A0A5B0S5X5_PUCGR|nr:hypothetical protein PGTUg99_017734 [Puccinia graminis f. sp. tritici]